MTSETKTSSESDRVGDLTRDELKALMRELVQELLWEIEQRLPDPDEGLELQDEVADHLHQAMADKKRGKPLADVMQELGLDG